MGWGKYPDWETRGPKANQAAVQALSAVLRDSEELLWVGGQSFLFFTHCSGYDRGSRIKENIVFKRAE